LAEKDSLTAPAAPPEPAANTSGSQIAGDAQAGVRKPGLFGRTFEWFWRGRAFKALKGAALTEGDAALMARARVLFELGERARKPAEPLPAPGLPAAAELYREAAFFAVRALNGPQAGDGSSPWQALEGERLVRIAGRDLTRADVEQRVEADDFAALWNLPKELQGVRAEELRRIARGLLDELSWRTRARDALWIQRLVRIGLVFAVALFTAIGLRVLFDHQEQARDLAAGKPWTTSSSSGGLGCQSPLQLCAESPDFFFHTQEERNPWVEIDLGAATHFSAVRVINRRDCCFDRALPLVVEVSADHEHYREIGRRVAPFSSWLLEAPADARYVRIRIAGRNILHLAQVRVLR